MSDLDGAFVDLHMMIRSHGISVAPHMHRRDVYRLIRHIGFEPNGKASETWEYTWFLELPWCYHHLSSVRDGWVKGNNNDMMCFHGSSMRLVISMAVNFLRQALEQGLKLGENIREKDTSI